MVSERGARIGEYRKRKTRLQQRRVAVEQLAALIADGWVERRRLKSGKIVVEKEKVHDEVLENRLWCILYHLGATDLNEGRKFQIEVVAEGERIKKQVDVYGRIDDVVIVAECKSSGKKTKRSLQKDVGEFASLQKGIANAVRKHYGQTRKPKIVWLMATSNIIWASPDKARAEDHNIHVMQDRDLRYFEEIAKNVGPAARYQFLAEFLKDQQIPALSNYRVPAIRTKLGGTRAYLFIAPPSRLLPVAFVNHRGLRDPEGAPSYQRVLKRSRLKEIGKYLDAGGYFPNCITVNFQKSPRFDQTASIEDRQIAFGDLYLPDRFKSVWVIDGQHRLYGFTEADEEARHALPVLAFEKLPRTEEAELFTTVNSKQQRVAPGLLDELAGELRWESEDFGERSSAIAARVLDLMAAKTGGPFEDRVKTGDLSESDTVSLTVSEVKKGIIASRLLGTQSKGVVAPGAFTRAEPEDTLHALYEGLTAYFTLIEEANQERWERGRAGYVCSNIGVQGHVRLIQALADFLRIETSQEPHDLDAEELIEQLKPYLAPVLEFLEEATDEEFAKKFKQPFGSGGPPRYFGQLCLLVQRKFPKFNPPGLQQFLQERDIELEEKGNALVSDLVKRVQTHIVELLKQTYGPKDYWDKGIPQKQIKVAAYTKKVEDEDNDLPIETYLDVIDLKKIVETKENWGLFKDSLSIQLPEEKKGQSKYLKWVERLNEVRRIAAHPMNRSYKDADIEFLDFINEQLTERGV
jgi:DGQHR domain-containing protein